MKTIESDGNIVCYDNYDSDLEKEIEDFLNSEKLKSFLKYYEEKFILVLGGDGTMLRAIRENHEKNMAFLGINFGNKGFLLNNKNTINLEADFEKREYPLLEAEINGQEKIYIAFNEIDIRSNSGRIIELDISLSNKKSIKISGDGVIISTPAGSTGYNSSLGGTIIPHTINALLLTSKAPLKPKLQSSIVLPANEVITIKNSGRRSDTKVYMDSIETYIFDSNSDFEIEIKCSEKKVELLIAKDYVNSWDDKVLGEQGFR